MRVYQRSPYNTRSTELMPFVLVLVRIYKLYIFLKYGSPLTHRNLRLGCGGAAISRLPERLFGRQPRTLSPQDYRSSQKSGRCVDSGFQSFLHQCVGGVRAVCHPVLRIRQTPADEYRLDFDSYTRMYIRLSRLLDLKLLFKSSSENLLRYILIPRQTRSVTQHLDKITYKGYRRHYSFIEQKN